MCWDKNKYFKDIKDLSALLEKYDEDQLLASVYGPLYASASKHEFRQQDRSLTLNVEGVQISLSKKMASSIPLNLDYVVVSLELANNFNFELDITENDRIEEDYNFQIEIEGYCDEGDVYYNAWHLDKDIESSGEQKFTHPSYHFQNGGRNMEEKDTLGVVFLAGPRLPHPPMDIFLGLHFLFNNFCNLKDYPFLKRLFNDPDYQDLLERARERMFLPYFSAFRDDNEHKDFTIGKVFPMAVS